MDSQILEKWSVHWTFDTSSSMFFLVCQCISEISWSMSITYFAHRPLLVNSWFSSTRTAMSWFRCMSTSNLASWAQVPRIGPNLTSIQKACLEPPNLVTSSEVLILIVKSPSSWDMLKHVLKPVIFRCAAQAGMWAHQDSNRILSKHGYS